MAPGPRRAARPRTQRGAALLTAMIIVTLVATLAASMVWQQWRAVQVESAERARVQAAWILSGALDFARLILKEDQKTAYTALTEPWATPLAEARLSTFLAVDKSNADDGPEAFLSGYITDAQSRYNLTSLLKDDGTIDPDELATLERLCQSAGIAPSVAGSIAAGLRDAKAAASGTAPLQPATFDQLAWLGVDVASLEGLRPLVVLLPERSQVNVNTASREVLAAVVKLDAGTAERLVQYRQSRPFKFLNEFTAQLGTAPPTNAQLTVKSAFFEVYARLRLADRVLIEKSLIKRVGGPPQVLRRERQAAVETAGS